MTDLISREAAIAAIEALPPEWARKDSMAEFNQVTIKQVREALTNMPSALVAQVTQADDIYVKKGSTERDDWTIIP